MARMNINTPKAATTSLRPVLGSTGSRKAQFTDRIIPGDLARQGMIEDPESTENQPVIYRKVLLRIVFWALGLAACFGAAGVIFAGHDTLWRIVGTCAATAAGAFLVLAASRQLDRETTWLPGVMAISLLVTEYLATLGLIWKLFGSADEAAALTMLFLAATSVPAIGFTGILKRPDGALSARVGLVASVVVFVLLMVGTWGGWLGAVRAERWHSLGLSLAVFAVLAVLCLIGSGTDRRHWRWLGVAAAGAAFAISAYAIIRDIHETSAFFVCVVSVAAVVAHANAMAWCPLKPAQQWLLWGTIGAGIATGGFVDWARITSPWQEEMLGRLAGAAAIIAGCGTLALLILARINQRNVPVAAALADLREITLTCPRCRAKQTIAIGSGKCGTCGLLIQVRVQEPEPEEQKVGARMARF
jgi:hypothetical protein